MQNFDKNSCINYVLRGFSNSSHARVCKCLGSNLSAYLQQKKSQKVTSLPFKIYTKTHSFYFTSIPIKNRWAVSACIYTVVVGIDPYWHTQLLSCKELLYCSLIRHPFISCDFTVSSNFSLEMNILFR